MDINKLNSKQRKLYFMLEEFVNEEDLSKFSTVSTPLKFKNGAYMNLWFKYHKLEIMNNVDSLSLKVQEQFLEYSKNRSAIIEEKEYKNKLKEFCLDANEDKFIKNSKVFFEDKTHKGVWFNNYMDMILFSNDKVSLKIKEQYNAFLKNTSKRKKDPFKEKIIEFANEKDMMKFKRNGGVLFLDETSKDRWFDAYKYKIFNSRDTICLIIEEQYKIFKKTYIDYEETNVMYEDSELNNDSFYVKVKSKDERKA